MDYGDGGPWRHGSDIPFHKGAKIRGGQMKKRIVRTIVLVATLDTKGLAIGYIQDKIRAQGHETIVIDAGILDKPEVKADISREEVAKAGGASLEELLIRAQKTSDRMQIIQVMIEGAAQTVKKLYDQGKVDGLFSLDNSFLTVWAAPPIMTWMICIRSEYFVP